MAADVIGNDAVHAGHIDAAHEAFLTAVKHHLAGDDSSSKAAMKAAGEHLEDAAKIRPEGLSDRANRYLDRHPWLDKVVEYGVPLAAGGLAGLGYSAAFMSTQTTNGLWHARRILRKET